MKTRLGRVQLPISMKFESSLTTSRALSGDAGLRWRSHMKKEKPFPWLRVVARATRWTILVVALEWCQQGLWAQSGTLQIDHVTIKLSNPSVSTCSGIQPTVTTPAVSGGKV